VYVHGQRLYCRFMAQLAHCSRLYISTCCAVIFYPV